MITVKICGLSSESVVESAIESGADRVGFVLVDSSPRFVPFQRAQALIRHAEALGAEPWVVAAYSIAGGPHVPWLDQLVDETPEIAAVQLHGKETPADVAAFVKRHTLVPVVKAFGVSTRADLARAEKYEAADAFLFDARPPAGAARGGGFGKAFDWSILKGFRVHDHEDWTLSGGLTPENVAEAIRVSGAAQVDVSSGVESGPGVKDTAKVKAFIKAAKAAG
ncbi:MAG: phosphoribosylanthranilate isomerase [Alphaproteobacteria bacterium]|nr:phosphoribosylanthranilate isomerase [Alphaproteobacteria bacterium]